jgi:hypothetical protein
MVRGSYNGLGQVLPLDAFRTLGQQILPWPAKKV